MDARSNQQNDSVNDNATLAALTARVTLLETELERSEEHRLSHLESLQKEQEAFSRLSDENALLKNENDKLKLETTEYAAKEDAYLAQLLRAEEEIEKLKSALPIKQRLPPLKQMFTFSHASASRDSPSTMQGSEQHKVVAPHI